eukprot:TRINITY_DN8941_c0_g3_i2.p4 TRINITY_DN8941_c0_g3~~TRINITY_DN8941_c0_g3_i2.p4  ORF type:complete len:120 (-),score=3.42 TRINITY_DN8941_c0_g3_i2:404-763(-)
MSIIRIRETVYIIGAKTVVLGLCYLFYLGSCDESVDIFFRKPARSCPFLEVILLPAPQQRLFWIPKSTLLVLVVCNFFTSEAVMNLSSCHDVIKSVQRTQARNWLGSQESCQKRKITNQ